MQDKITTAVYGSPDRPLKIGGKEIPAYVLEDGTRVLVQRGMQEALGLGQGGGRARNSDRLTQFVNGIRIKPFISEEISMRTQNPIKFKLP